MLRWPILIFLAASLLCAQEQSTIACNQARATALEQSAREVMQQRGYDTAIQRFQAALSACPGQPAIQLELGNAYFMGQHFREAIEISRKVLQADPGNAAALEIKGNSEYLAGDTAAAISTFIDLLEKHPEREEAPYMLGRIYYQQDTIDQAIGQFERVLRLNGHSYKAYDGLGLCYEAKGDNAKATGYFLTAIKLVEKDHPEYDVAYADLSELLLKTGDTRRAFDAAAMAAKRNPRSARNFYLGGKALEQLGKTELAVNWLERSVALDPNYAQSLYVLARIYHKLGQEQKASEARRKFLEVQAKAPGKSR